MTYAASGDTWGLSGPTFLLYYGIAALLLLAISVIHRRILFGGAQTTGAHLGPQQLAYLNGGAQLAISSALGGLRAAGAIGSEKRALTRIGPLSAGATPLDT